MIESCSNCGSESGEIEYSLEGRKFFHCHSCLEFTKLHDKLLDRIERDVGG